jgi:hypothetical protein
MVRKALPSRARACSASSGANESARMLASEHTCLIGALRTAAWMDLRGKGSRKKPTRRPNPSPPARDRKMSGEGQTEKNSARAYVFRYALKLGHCSRQSACLKRANFRLQSAALGFSALEPRGSGLSHCRFHRDGGFPNYYAIRAPRCTEWIGGQCSKNSREPKSANVGATCPSRSPVPCASP